MPTLRLFDGLFTIDTTDTEFEPVQGFKLRLRLDAHGSALYIQIAGSFGVTHFDALSARIRCRIDGENVILTPGSAGSSGNVIITLGGVADTYPSPDLVVGQTPNHSGFTMRLPRNLRDEIVQARPEALLTPSSRFNAMDRWSASLLLLSLSRRTVDLIVLDDRPELQLIDQFGPVAATARVAQRLRLHAVGLEADTLRVVLRPRRDAVFLSPDILDPVAAPDEEANALLYQHVAADAQVKATINHIGSNTWRSGGWALEPHDGRPDFLLAVPALKDEHGHPIVLAVGSPLPLATRQGLDQPRANGQLNRAVVLGDPQQTITVPVSVVAIDAAAVYGRSRTPGSLQADGTIPTPYWVVAGHPAVLRHRPREILGLSRNTALRTGRDRAPIGGHLQLAPLYGRSLGLLFVTPSLSFEATADMSLAADVPERAVFGTDEALRRRTAPAIVGKTITLPLLDLVWTFADLAGIRQTGDKQLAQHGARWAVTLNQDLVGVFPSAGLADYTHVAGHRADPVDQSFAFLQTMPPATTSIGGERKSELLGPVETVLNLPHQHSHALLDLATVSSSPRADTTNFLFGGPRVDTAIATARKRVQDGRTEFGDYVETFFQFWAGVLGPLGGASKDEWRAARSDLRTYLVGRQPLLDRPEHWSFDDFVEASARLAAACDVIALNPPEPLGFDAVAPYVIDSLPDEVAELLDPAASDDPASLLFQYAFAPPSMDVLKRALEAVSKAPGLEQHRATLQLVVTPDLTQAVADIFQGARRPEGFLAELLQGLSDPFSVAAEIWRRNRTSMDSEIAEILDDLADRYGPVFTPTVYREILKNAEDSADLVEAFAALGLPLARLADLPSEPPDYLLVSRRLRRPGLLGPSDEGTRLHPVDAAAALWNHRYDFCSFGSGKAWDFFLDDRSTIVVKLGGERSLAEILKEIHESYASPERPDPLGLAPERSSSGSQVQDFLGVLPEDLTCADWRGALIINPMIDLDRDPVLRVLCGFPHIIGRFAAIGGNTPDALAGVSLDVWGRIERRAPKAGWTEEDGAPRADEPLWGEADVGWSLIKFDATVKGTTVIAGEIAFVLEFKELFGRRLDWDPITIAGTLPPTSGSVAGKPRDFTFAATLREPKVFEIDVQFIKSLKLRGIRVGSHDGETVLNIDADIAFRDYSFGSFNLDPPKGDIRLSDFRIRLPELPPGRVLGMGLFRPLRVDLGAIRFPVMAERQLTLAGVDIRPTAFGLLRDTQEEITRFLDGTTVPLADPSFPLSEDTARKYAYPFVDLDIDFGKSPLLGGGSRLALTARLGVPVTDAGGTMAGAPGVGLVSLTGKHLTVSLFRLLTLEIEELNAGTIAVYDPETGTQTTLKAGTIRVEGFNLKVASWSLFEQTDERRLLFVHPYDSATGQGASRGLLAWYAAGSPPTSGFLRLHWLLLARNLSLGKLVEDALLDGRADNLDNERAAIGGILTGSPPDRLNANVGEQPWLFGIRFELGELFTPCTLVLQDGRYYGIRLGGPVARLLTGEDDLTFAYLPGPEPGLDRFRTSFRCPALDLVPGMRSGVLALEWSPSWDFLIDVGQPWRGPNGYDWERSFSIPVGIYEAKFGFFVEKRTTLAPPPGVDSADGRFMTFSAGAGFYLGYRFELNAGIAWVRAGIGIFGVLIGSATLKLADGGGDASALLRGSLVQLKVAGVIGIYAYGEGGVDVWILSARFRVSAQAFVEVTLLYVPGSRSYIAWDATLSAGYSASVRVGSGFFSWTFRVSGAVQMRINGRAPFG